MSDNNKWSKKVSENSNALDLENGVFRLGDPKKIAESLKRSAQQSKRRKGSPYQSAMSMLNFYINRAGKNLTEERKKTLELSKIQLKELFNKTKIEKKPLKEKNLCQTDKVTKSKEKMSIKVNDTKISEKQMTTLLHSKGS